MRRITARSGPLSQLGNPKGIFMKHIEYLKFVEAALEYWVAIDEASSRRANAKNRTIEKIVAGWVKHGIAIETLLSLVDSDEHKVKLAAAAHLLHFHETRDKALVVLRDLQANDRTLVSHSAGAVLRIHEAGKLR